MPTPESNSNTPSRVYVPTVSVDGLIEPDKHVLLWQVRGTSDFTVSEEPYRLTVGQAIWVPFGTEHGFTVHVNSVLLPMFFPLIPLPPLCRNPLS